MKMAYCSILFLVLALLAGTSHAQPVTDGLIIHLRADELELNDGDDVTVWSDSASAFPNGTVVQDSTLSWKNMNANPPSFIADAGNGYPAVHFDGANTEALRSGTWTWVAANVPATTMFIRSTGGAATATVYNSAIGSYRGYGSRFVATVPSSGDTSGGSGLDWGDMNAKTGFADNPVVDGQWFNAAYRHQWYPRVPISDPNTLYAVGDGTPLDLVYSSAASPYIVSVNWFSVGNGILRSYWKTPWYTGDIAEVMVYLRALSEEEIQATLEFLDAKYTGKSASNPSPAHMSVGQGTKVGSQAEVTFGWNIGLDPNSQPNRAITSHSLYYSTDPTFAGVTPIVIPAASPVEPGMTHTALLDTDAKYYWRVDEFAEYDGQDPNTFVGPIWTFETIETLATIDVQPVRQTADVGGTATFTVSATSVTAITYEWFYSSDNSAITPDDDVSLGNNAATLEVTDVEMADEGYYYCVVTNKAGPVSSNTAPLGVKRIVAHWSLDVADYVNGEYVDKVGGHNCVPKNLPEPNMFIPGVSDLSAEGLPIASVYAAHAGTWEPGLYTNEMTISLWVQIVNGTRQGIVTKRNFGYTSWIWQIFPNGNMDFRMPGVTVPGGNMVAWEDQWVHLAATVSTEATRLYVNTNLANSGAGRSLPITLATIMLGANDGDVLAQFAGSMDDIRIYNYAMTHEQLLDVAYQATGVGFCIDPPAAYDAAGGGPDGTEPDCKVDLSDFAVFVAQWLKCGLYPVEYCD